MVPKRGHLGRMEKSVGRIVAKISLTQSQGGEEFPTHNENKKC
jgi:hypothetical protein